MGAVARLGLYGLGLLAVFAAATGVGMAVGPVGAGTSATDSHETSGDTGHEEEPEAGHGEESEAGHGEESEAGHGEGHAEEGDDTAPAAQHMPGGLTISQDGYTFAPVASALAAKGPREFAYRVLGPDGRPVTSYTPTHDKKMHLIVVRRDLSGFEHVHPRLGTDGVWRVRLPFPQAGQYRAFADFQPAAARESLTLGADVSVAGSLTPRALPAASRSYDVDGYIVTLRGTLVPGKQSKLTLSVRRNGQPVRDLQPYLAAYGHLVALRDGDLAYLHVHPDGEPGDGRTRPGPDITFYATAPSTGAYRLFLDFRHGDRVRTAEFTVTVPTHTR